MTDPIATTRQGTVRGFERHALLYFRGIPYARPPVGDLRFRAPEPPEPWEGVRDATEYGPNSLQSSIASDIPLPPQPRRPMSEDCLYLNVVTPGLSGSRPVIVWIHGGGFTTGSGADFAGRQLAERGVVVVAMNYRLGALGSLALPALADRKGRFTNFGLRDQIAALRWVHDNIASFGGDPDNVTIFGESAGGLSVGSLLGSPEAKGLFHRAIPQSGAGHQARPADEALSASEQFCELLGVRPDDPRCAPRRLARSDPGGFRCDGGFRRPGPNARAEAAGHGTHTGDRRAVPPGAADRRPPPGAWLRCTGDGGLDRR